MPQRPAVDSSNDIPIIGYSGIYNADGGLTGEVRYVLGHLFGTLECALCDITHSPVRRKPEWDRMVARVGVPITLLHRNELDERLQAAVRGVTLPVVLAHRSDGSTRVALTADQLAGLDGSIGRLEETLFGPTLGSNANRSSLAE
ncbi:MAG: hypothetical protein WBX17_08775 [Microbacterium sp.]